MREKDLDVGMRSLKKKEDVSVSKGWIRMMRGGVRVRCPGKLEAEGLDKEKEELDKKEERGVR